MVFFYLGLILMVVATGLFLFFPLTRFAALVSAILGTALMLYSGLKFLSDNSSHPFAFAVLLNLLRAAFVIAFVSFSTVQLLIVSGYNTDADAAGADYIIVLGAGVEGTEPSLSLQSRLIASLNYLNNNPDCVAVLSGGQGPNEDITEAECMRRFLEERNIAPERLILEQQSTDTIQNIRNSLSLISSQTHPLSEVTIDEAKIAVLSNEFHLFRAKLIGGYEGYDLVAVSAPTPRTDLLITYQIREFFSIIKVFLSYLFI